MKLIWEVLMGTLFMLASICLLITTCLFAFVEVVLGVFQFPFKYVRKKLAAVLLKMAGGRRK